MKLVIIEGTDRVGKDTLIDSLLKKYPNSQSIHWGYPRGTTNEEKIAYQEVSFNFWMRDYFFKNRENNLDLLIWNRSHIGEHVYGSLYRNYDTNWVFDLENKFLAEQENIYLVLLHADPEFIVKHDDGKSYSNSLENKYIENKKFKEAFNKSKIINKIKIKVNEGINYINPDSIFSIVDRAINL